MADDVQEIECLAKKIISIMQVGKHESDSRWLRDKDTIINPHELADMPAKLHELIICSRGAGVYPHDYWTASEGSIVVMSDEGTQYTFRAFSGYGVRVTGSGSHAHVDKQLSVKCADMGLHVDFPSKSLQ